MIIKNSAWYHEQTWNEPICNVELWNYNLFVAIFLRSRDGKSRKIDRNEKEVYRDGQCSRRRKYKVFFVFN